MSKPRVGFLGLGWIGRARLRGLIESDSVEVVALADSSSESLQQASALAPKAPLLANIDELLSLDLDGIVIATPSGLHADACVRALARGLSVFCQKPLARDEPETKRVVEAARAADRLLRVDFCYRHTGALRALRALVQSGSIGNVYAAELTFHNAYGPDKSWARDPQLAGGGCLVDLGVHLLDAAFWILGDRSIVHTDARLYSAGLALTPSSNQVEDFAVAQLELANHTRISLACSWQSSFGDHARIRIGLFGDRGGAAFENVDGSFYDFTCERYQGNARETLYRGTEEWGSRAIVSWAEELALSPTYRADPQLLQLASAIDRLYGRTSRITLEADARLQAAS